jgi:hypothetical protein
VDPLTAEPQSDDRSAAPAHRTAIACATISGVAAVAAAVVAGLMGKGPEFWTDLFSSTPPAPVRTVTVKLPGDGLLPHTNIDVAVPDARTKPGESLWLAIQNLKDTTWHLYACTTNSAGQGTCTDVPVGASVDAPGPWSMTAVVVDPDGHAKIVEERAKHKGDLFAWFGEDLTAIGSATGHRR